MLPYFALTLLILLIFFRPFYSGLVYLYSDLPSNQYYLLVFSLLPPLFISKSSKIWRLSRVSKEEWLWIGFIIWSGIALLWSVNRHSTLIQLELVLTYFYIYFLVKRVSPAFRNIVILAIIIPSIWVSLYGIYQYFWGLEETRKFVEMMGRTNFSPDFLTRLYTNRAFSTFVYPNAFAGYLIVLIPFTLAFFFKMKRPLRYLYLLIVFLQVFGLILTKSKGGILSLVLSGLLLIYLLLPRKWKISSTLAVLLLAILLFSFPLVKKSAKDSFGVRISYWKSALRMAKVRPLTGFGPGCFGRVFPRFKEAGREDTKMVHNNYLQIFSEGGIIYLLLFLSFFYFSLKNLHLGKDKILIMGIQTGVTAFLIHSLVDFDFYVPGITLLLFSIIPLGIEPSTSEKNTFSKFYLYSFLILIPIILFTTLRIIRADVSYKENLYALKKGNIERAVSFLKKSIRIYPWGEDIYKINYRFRLGELYLREGEEIDKAIAELHYATKLDPYRFFYWEKLALLYALKKDYKNALNYINHALYCYPSHPRLKKEREEILKKINE